MTTTTKTQSFQAAVNVGNLNNIADALREMKAGYCLSPIKLTLSSMTGTAVLKITTAAVKAKAVAAGSSGITLDTGENYPAIGIVKTLRVTTGNASAGLRSMSDSGDTATTTIALLADDGTTITFEDTITGCVLEYYPAPAVVMTADFEPPTQGGG